LTGLLLDGNKQWFCLNSENSSLAAVVAGTLIVACSVADSLRAFL